MASYFDLKGTTIDSFKIGKGGPTLNRSGSSIIKLNGTEQLVTENTLHPGYRANSWYNDTIFFDAYSAVTTTTAINTISYFLFQIPRTVNIVRFAFNQGSTATGGFRIGIYSNNYSTALPDTLLASSTEINATGTGEKGFDTNISLTPGWYWKAINGNVAPSLSCENAYPAYNYYLSNSIFSTGTVQYGLRNNLTYANSTLPTNAPVDGLSSITFGVPIMFFKTAT
ncbi:MAG: hypothetical protein HWQ35_05725 [Nostoc sp. NMS1]|uniref:hypothetical protein n=1 Tax=Nostoc sp. NMS1 TaxID=2815388 RepID=UPI0025D6E2C7|nr:hypothetical protein [Nostoc sp. NMS1]MBN3906061.1 hypothetical protein [Nostoc sp. NMS1]